MSNRRVKAPLFVSVKLKYFLIYFDLSLVPELKSDYLCRQQPKLVKCILCYCLLNDNDRIQCYSLDMYVCGCEWVDR